jgi:plastocyanin
MKRGVSALIACSALAFAAGCGSSSKPSAASSSTATASSTSTGGGFKVTAKPRYASPSPSAPVQSGSVQVAYRNITIAPDTLKVKVGSTVVWTSYDPIQHNVTSMEGPLNFKSTNLGEGGTFRVRMTKPGIIHYECTIHPASMNGTIEVLR